jgi:hypothetical protein
MDICRFDLIASDMYTAPFEIGRAVTEPAYFDALTPTGPYYYGRQVVEVSFYPISLIRLEHCL